MNNLKQEHIAEKVFHFKRHLKLNLETLSNDKVNEILDSLIFILKNTRIDSQTKWKEMSNYFSNKNKVSKKWSEIFKSKKYDLETLIDYVEVIKKNITSDNIEFSLRIIEVTLSPEYAIFQNEDLIIEKIDNINLGKGV